MANKRQKEARKRFRGASDGAPVANAEPAKKELKEAKEANGRQVKNKVQKKPLKLKKHPLRVAGNKPGDGCFMCKSKDHVAKFCPQKTDSKICLLCRERGHTLKHCPSKEHAEAKLCYNCGETGHRLAQCTKPLKDGGTSFAECFLCKQRGHISKNCSLNSHGIYPKGGSCKLCGEVTHLAKDCPSKTNANGKTQKMKLQISNDVAPAGEKRLVFKSGDDLEDDFEEF